MEINLNLPIVFSSAPAVGQVAATEQAHPEVQQSRSQDESIEKLRKDNEQVQKTDKSQHPLAVEEEGQGRGRQQGQHMREREEPSAPEEEPQPEPHSENPWAGHIVDRKI